MQQNSVELPVNAVEYLVGNEETVKNMSDVRALSPFSDFLVDFSDSVSRKLLADSRSAAYPDVITLAFWLRKSSMLKLKEKFLVSDGNISLGRGMVFHIAPSNVPVNFAYSLFTGLICGNANVVRVPTKDFLQVQIIVDSINSAFTDYPGMKPYIVLVKYGHIDEVNAFLSSLADVRVIWGGDATINNIRKFPIKPRATEITFADRYSLAVIDSDFYLQADNKEKIAKNFYNDTYLTDQNACTSPRAVVWTGDSIEEAKEMFWSQLHGLIENKYEISGVQAVNKLCSFYLFSSGRKCSYKPMPDNLIVRVQVDELSRQTMQFKDNSGYFFEYDCDDLLKLEDICSSEQCQTITYLGNKDSFIPLLSSGVKGIDRVVPMGHSMDFDFIWDGYNLVERLTRKISLL